MSLDFIGGPNQCLLH